MRVVAYARVSSDHEDQINSYNNQLLYWKEYIENREGWTFAGLYADEGISGTNTLKRTDFNRMIKEASQDKFDFICTKSVSRFARNTVDCLQSTRHLKKIKTSNVDKIGVYFEKDNINTLDNDGELRLTIMATLAQEESRNTSENVKWGHKRAMKNGVVFGANRILGFNLVNKKLEINDSEARIIKQIFEWFYYDNESLHSIVKLLSQPPFNLTKGKMGGTINHTSIKRILSNEKYCGDLKQGKYGTEDFLTHKKIKNKDNFIIIKDNHPAIIDRELWENVQIKLNENVKKFNEQRIGYSKHVWNGKIICECGNKFRRKTLQNKDGTDRPVYICISYNEHGKKACQNGSYIREDILKEIFVNIFKVIISNNDKQLFVKNAINVLDKIIKNNNKSKDLELLKKELNQIENKKSKLLDLYLDGNKITKDVYEDKDKQLTNIKESLLVNISQIENKNLILNNKKKKLEHFYELINKTIQLDEFNEKLVDKCLDKIVVSKNTVKIYLITGDEYIIDRNIHSGSTISTTQPLWIFDYQYKVDSIVDRYKTFKIEVILSA